MYPLINITLIKHSCIILNTISIYIAYIVPKQIKKIIVHFNFLWPPCMYVAIRVFKILGVRSILFAADFAALEKTASMIYLPISLG